MAYPVTHFEINAQDAPATQKFYRDLFGWGIDTNNPQNYGIIDTKNKGTGINGGIGESQQGKSFVTFYVETDDPAATLAKAERLGGRRVMEPMGSGNVVYALFADPEVAAEQVARAQELAGAALDETRSAIAGTSCGASAGFPTSTLWSKPTALGLQTSSSPPRKTRG